MKVLKSDGRSRSNSYQLPIAPGATALSKAYLVKVLPEGSVLCTHCQGQENALGGEADGLVLLHEGTT